MSGTNAGAGAVRCDLQRPETRLLFVRCLVASLFMETDGSWDARLPHSSRTQTCEQKSAGPPVRCRSQGLVVADDRMSAD